MSIMPLVNNRVWCILSPKNFFGECQGFRFQCQFSRIWVYHAICFFCRWQKRCGCVVGGELYAAILRIFYRPKMEPTMLRILFTLQHQFGIIAFLFCFKVNFQRVLSPLFVFCLFEVFYYVYCFSDGYVIKQNKRV